MSDDQDTKIINFLRKNPQDSAPLSEEALKNFAKSLLIFQGKSDNYTRSDRSCQVASLDDLQGGHTLKIKKQDKQSGLVIKLDTGTN